MENRDRFQSTVLALGFLFLLLGAYLDNVRGPLLPIITQELALRYSQSSLLIVAGNVLAIPATFLLLPLQNRFGLKTLVMVTLGLVTLIPVVAAGVKGLGSLALLGAYLGVTISVLGTLCNIMVVSGVPERWQSRSLALLHAFYGVGSFCAAVGVNTVSGLGLRWYHVFSIGSVVALTSFIPAQSLERRRVGVDSSAPLFLSGREWLVALIFCVYVMGEVGCTIWLVTFLTEAQGMANVLATRILGALFLVMALSRLIAFLFVKPETEVAWSIGGLFLAVVAFAAGHWVTPYAFALVGAFGPFFPAIMARASRAYKKSWRTVMVWVVVGLQLGLACVHLIIGNLVDLVGVRVGFYLPAAFLVLTIGLVWFWNRGELSGNHLKS